MTGTSASERPSSEDGQAGSGARSLGILGGTFNPPHLGHLAVASHALAELALDHVWLMPANSPPHKRAGQGPSAAQRLSMCRLLVAGVAGVSACALEIERGGPSYTVDTLRAIHASDPEAELTFIVGADTAATIASWREPAELLGLCRLAVAARTGSDRREVLDTVAAVLDGDGAGQRAAAERVRFLEMDNVEVSSSLVRDRLARGEPIGGLVRPSVAAYIDGHALYPAGAGAAS